MTGGGARACALLSDHAPSFQLLARHFRQAQAFARHTDSNGRLLHILRAYQLLSSTLAETFADHSTGIADQRAGLSPQKTVQQRFYWCGSSAEQSAVVTAGFSALQSPSRGEEWVVLHSDPALALALLPLGDDTFPSTAVPAVPYRRGLPWQPHRRITRSPPSQARLLEVEERRGVSAAVPRL